MKTQETNAINGLTAIELTYPICLAIATLVSCGIITVGGDVYHITSVSSSNYNLVNSCTFMIICLLSWTGLFDSKRMTFKRFCWITPLAVASSLGFGIFYAWIVRCDYFKNPSVLVRFLAALLGGILIGSTMGTLAGIIKGILRNSLNEASSRTVR